MRDRKPTRVSRQKISKPLEMTISIDMVIAMTTAKISRANRAKRIDTDQVNHTVTRAGGSSCPWLSFSMLHFMLDPGGTTDSFRPPMCVYSAA